MAKNDYEEFRGSLWGGKEKQHEIELGATDLRDRLQALLAPVLEGKYNLKLLEELSPAVLECYRLLVNADRADKEMGIKSRADYTEENLGPYSTIIGIRTALEGVWRASETLLMQKVLNSEPQIRVSSEYLEALVDLGSALQAIVRFLPHTNGTFGFILRPLTKFTRTFDLSQEIQKIEGSLGVLKKDEVTKAQFANISECVAQILAAANSLTDKLKGSSQAVPQIVEDASKLQSLVAVSAERVRLFQQVYLLYRLKDNLKPIYGYRVNVDSLGTVGEDVSLLPPASLDEAIALVQEEHPNMAGNSLEFANLVAERMKGSRYKAPSRNR